MTLGEIKEMVMNQTSNDAEDVTEFEPYILTYVNEGYDRVVFAFAKEHVSADSDTYPALAEDDTDSPALAEWMHPAIANWATWCIYRNGNPSKQNRGFQFRAAAEETIAQIRGGTATKFVNCPL